MAAMQLIFDLRSSPTGASHSALTEAMLDICQWADGLDGVDVSAGFLEHHGAPDGYMPSPIVFAAAAAGRTRRLKISTLVLAPFYHPLRLAEDLAALDLVSGGRVSFIIGAGYRKEEFDAFGVSISNRARLVEETIDTLKKAWTGEPFEFRGATVRVMPRPSRQPRPPILMGGSSKAAARRAARIADGFLPSSPELFEFYRDELIALGKEPAPPMPIGEASTTLVAVSHDPDEAWRAVGAHCLHEMNVYAAWLRDLRSDAVNYWELPDTDALRKTNRYLVLTPEQCVERAKQRGGSVAINPLTGGIAPELAWRSLKLIEAEVLPQLK